MKRGEIQPLPKFDRSSAVFTAEQSEVLTGLMLGDGCLYRHRSTHSPHLVVGRSSSDANYQEWLASVFQEHCASGVAYRSTYDNRTKKTYHSAVFRTRRLPVLSDWYASWYLNGKKVVPEDLEITSLALAVWFSDDGWIGRSASKNTRPGCLRIKLSTEGFSFSEVERLTSLLADRIGQPFSTTRAGTSGFTITGGNAAARALAAEVDGLLPPGMERKAIWRAIPDDPDVPRRSANAEKTHCKYGHEFTPENTARTSRGWRMCLECNRSGQRARYWARKQASV